MINIIPIPEKFTRQQGHLSFDKKTAGIYIPEEFSSLREEAGYEAVSLKDEALIKITYSEKEKREGYSLEIKRDGIEIEAADAAGAFYALQSLKQLIALSQEEKGAVRLSFLKIINDAPRYSWRGLHLDESRHFFGKKTVKKLLDFMSLYKLNRFHWHLTDDQGWRVEIEKYPRLTEIGSTRVGSQLHNWGCEDMDDKTVEGYYTKEDIREIVAYAKQRFIEIVPEIDFPAHSLAAIAGYNSLACREKECEVANYFGAIIPHKSGNKDWNRPLCLGKDEAVQFAFDVIEEVADLFPFGYFHVGGDEAPTNEWKKCPDCQKRIKDEKLKDEVALQGWFTNQLNDCLKKKGKTMIGWNEVLAADFVDSDIVAQYWTPKKDKNVTKHLEKGGKVILSNHKYFYFDMLYTYCTVKGTYSYSPEVMKIGKQHEKSILGVEAEMWTEWTATEKELFFKLWHRGLALSETAWSKEEAKDYNSFKNRLQLHKKIADEKGYYYGEDSMTLKPNGLKKTLLAKKNGFTIKDFDSEYRLSELMRK